MPRESRRPGRNRDWPALSPHYRGPRNPLGELGHDPGAKSTGFSPSLQAVPDRDGRRADRRPAPGAVRGRPRARRPSWPSRPWSSGTGRWSCASAAASWATHTTPRTPSRRPSWSWSRRPARSGCATRWAPGCTRSPAGPRPMLRADRSPAAPARTRRGEALAGGPARAATWRRPRRRCCTRRSTGCPSSYRAPVVLCDLEGLTHEQARRAPGLAGRDGQEPAGAGPRPAPARLVRRGLTPSAVLPAVSKAPPVQAVSAALIDQTVKTAARIVAGEAMTAGMVPAPVASLIRGGLRHMFLNK